MTITTRNFGIFISHSHKDDILLERIKKVIRILGLTPLTSVRGENPGTDPDVEIRKLIDISYGVVALLTENGCHSHSVNQEIGYSKGKKPIIPVLMDGQDISGVFLQKIEPIPINDDSWDSVMKIGEAIARAEWNPHNAIISDLFAIINAKEKKDVPFRCHKAPFGDPCDQPVFLHQEENGRYVLQHPPHTWESVYVSKSMGNFIKKYILDEKK